MVEKEEAGGGISEEEAAQYDRQIRLWGLEAQKRLRASRVLLVGMKGLGAEIAKNLILAGVKGLTMLDPEQVSPEDPGAQFLIRAGSVGRNRAEASLERAQNLNPMVDVKVDTESVEKKPESFFAQFDAVCLTCCSRDVIVKVDQICHKNSVKFFTGDVFGYHGYTFANLGEHEFVEEKTKVAKVSQGVEDGPDTKRAKLDSSETTMVKKALLGHFHDRPLECKRFYNVRTPRPEEQQMSAGPQVQLLKKAQAEEGPGLRPSLPLGAWHGDGWLKPVSGKLCGIPALLAFASGVTKGGG
ncbi:SUMO-activating enzyme subunit 1 [Suricata suricatta]|uniref:SUMO-activating enzyme subunit 1 n=1 Tax=Suricata suricatta TaxID=37032 RepID=UPI001155663D|nr:SUMO-activating enzyme subunit 1 [Suricata suricatta]